MSKIVIRTPGVNNSFRMFRVRPKGDPEEVKNEIMELMSDYLESNDGKLINMVVLKNREILCYFVVGQKCTDSATWEATISQQILHRYDVLPSVMELGPVKKQQTYNTQQDQLSSNNWESDYSQKISTQSFK